MRFRGTGSRPRPLDCIWIIVSKKKKSALLKMTAEEKRAGGFLPPEREARRVINNQDTGHVGLREPSSCSLSQGRKGKVSYCDLYPVIALTRSQVIYVFSPWLRGLRAASAERDTPLQPLPPTPRPHSQIATSCGRLGENDYSVEIPGQLRISCCYKRHCSCNWRI